MYEDLSQKSDKDADFDIAKVRNGPSHNISKRQRPVTIYLNESSLDSLQGAGESSATNSRASTSASIDPKKKSKESTSASSASIDPKTTKASTSASTATIDPPKSKKSLINLSDDDEDDVDNYALDYDENIMYAIAQNQTKNHNESKKFFNIETNNTEKVKISFPYFNYKFNLYLKLRF